MLEEGQTYTSLEHQWDEGFGYTGMTRRYGDWTRPQQTEGFVDDNGDNAIDLLREKAFHLAINAPKRDDGSVSGTTFAADLWDAFHAGRSLLANTSGTLTPGELEELRRHRNDALLAWETLLAANVIHYINETLDDSDRIGTVDYVFEDHATHWSEMKGFALGFQFSRHSAMTEVQFIQLHTHLGQRPAIASDGAAAVDAYEQDLLAARDLLQDVFLLDPADVTGW
jgi:hypothetical protein